MMWAYIYAASLLDYNNPLFRDWLADVTKRDIQGHSGRGVIGTAQKSANNWGFRAREWLLAAGLFLEDQEWIDMAVNSHKEALGLTVSNPQLVYTDTTWHFDPNNKSAINRKASIRNGVDMSFIIPEDWRRDPTGTEFTPNPKRNGYMWDVVQGLLVTATVLHEHKLVDISTADNAMEGVIDTLYRFGFPPEGDDLWLVPLINYLFNRDLPVTISNPGKNLGYTYWTHANLR